MVPTYKVNKIYRYSMVVEVEADSEEAAEAAAMEMDGEHNGDDCLYDITVRKT